jgi:hypothetical protein
MCSVRRRCAAPAENVKVTANDQRKLVVAFPGAIGARPSVSMLPDAIAAAVAVAMTRRLSLPLVSSAFWCKKPEPLRLKNVSRGRTSEVIEELDSSIVLRSSRQGKRIDNRRMTAGGESGDHLNSRLNARVSCVDNAQRSHFERNQVCLVTIRSLPRSCPKAGSRT